jgi:hypothetical protein
MKHICSVNQLLRRSLSTCSSHSHANWSRIEPPGGNQLWMKHQRLIPSSLKWCIRWVVLLDTSHSNIMHTHTSTPLLVVSSPFAYDHVSVPCVFVSRLLGCYGHLPEICMKKLYVGRKLHNNWVYIGILPRCVPIYAICIYAMRAFLREWIHLVLT